MADGIVLYQVDDKVGIITLNRPEKLNAISHRARRAFPPDRDHRGRACRSALALGAVQGIMGAGVCDAVNRTLGRVERLGRDQR